MSNDFPTYAMHEKWDPCEERHVSHTTRIVWKVFIRHVMRYCTALITTFAKSSFILPLAVSIFKQGTYLLSSTYYFFAKYISNVSHIGPHLKFGVALKSFWEIIKFKTEIQKYRNFPILKLNFCCQPIVQHLSISCEVTSSLVSSTFSNYHLTHVITSKTKFLHFLF